MINILQKGRLQVNVLIGIQLDGKIGWRLHDCGGSEITDYVRGLIIDCGKGRVLAAYFVFPNFKKVIGKNEFING